MTVSHEHEFVMVHAWCRKCGRACARCGISEREYEINESLGSALFRSAEVA